MLDDFRNPMKDSSSQDHLDQHSAGSSQKKIALVLTAGALILAASLFFSGPSESSPEVSADADTRLSALATRVETLEMLLKQPGQGQSFIALTTSDEVTQLPQDEESQHPKQDSTESLKALIAQELSNTPTEPPQAAEVAPVKKTVATQKQAAKTYTVQRGDTLSTISQKVYGTSKRWQDIAHANKGKVSSDNQVRVGTTLTIP